MIGEAVRQLNHAQQLLDSCVWRDDGEDEETATIVNQAQTIIAKVATGFCACIDDGSHDIWDGSARMIYKSSRLERIEVGHDE